MSWPEVKLERLFKITSSKRVFQKDWKSEGVPFYRAREIVKLSKNGYVNNELFISNEMYDEYSLKYGIPEEGDIMVTGVGTLGICYVVKKNDKFYFKDGNIIWFKKNSDVNSYFVEHLFKTHHVRKQIDNSAGSTVGTYTISKAKNTVIPLPNRKEQDRIVGMLNRVDEIEISIDKIRFCISQLNESIFLDMFGDPTKVKEGSLIQNLSDLVEADKPICYGIVQPGPKQKIGIPYIRPVDFQNGYIKIENLPLTTEEIDNEFARSRVLPGDIVMSVRGSIGVVALVPDELERANISRGPVRISIKDKKLRCYVYHALRTPYVKRWMLERTKGAAIKGINTKDVRQIPIALPPEEILCDFYDKITSYNQILESGKDLANSSSKLNLSLVQEVLK